ncbi:MAG: DUF3332 family protein [Candidatus Brocadiia bacterium]
MGKWGRRSIGMFGPRLIRLVACIVLIALLPMAMGCYGSFPITHTIYKFNGEVTRFRLVHTIVFWVFIIIPVYWIGILADAIVLNLIEFWTGESATVSSQTLPDGTRVTLEPSADGKEAVLIASRDGKVLQSVHFIRISEKEVQVFDDAGRKLGSVVRSASSGLILTDAQGASVRTISAGEISDFRKAMEQLHPTPAPQVAAPG